MGSQCASNRNDCQHLSKLSIDNFRRGLVHRPESDRACCFYCRGVRGPENCLSICLVCGCTFCHRASDPVSHAQQHFVQNRSHSMAMFSDSSVFCHKCRRFVQVSAQDEDSQHNFEEFCAIIRGATKLGPESPTVESCGEGHHKHMDEEIKCGKTGATTIRVETKEYESQESGQLRTAERRDALNDVEKRPDPRREEEDEGGLAARIETVEERLRQLQELMRTEAEDVRNQTAKTKETADNDQQARLKHSELARVRRETEERLMKEYQDELAGLRRRMRKGHAAAGMGQKTRSCVELRFKLGGTKSAEGEKEVQKAMRSFVSSVRRTVCEYES